MDCIFCAIVDGQIPSTTVYANERTYAFLDIAPGSEGHMIVIPKAHSADIRETEVADLTAVFATAQLLAKRAYEVLDCDGVNIINNCGAAAGQTVFHTHVHVIPRYLDSDKDRVGHPWIPQPASADDLAALGAKLAL